MLERARKEGEKIEEEHIDFTSVSVGDYIVFGAYEQDNDLTNGKEPIEWLVLDAQDGKALLISKYVLDCRKFNTTNTQVAWESSSIRSWLNEEFLSNAFSVEEQAMISTTALNVNTGIEVEEDTEDKIFLLSFEEAKCYFSVDSDRQCSPTEYARAQGCRTNIDKMCWWWLRSLDLFNYYHAGLVYFDGSLDYGNVQTKYNGVRPALWLTLENSENTQQESSTEEIEKRN